MNAFLKLLAGLAAVALIGAAALLFEGAPGSAGSAQEKLAARAADILEEQEADWASVRIDGQKAILSGEAPTQEARETLITAVAAAEGRGGLFSGGVTAVDASGLAAAPPEPVADPYIFIAERENGTLALSGYVPDQATRDAVYELARELFPDTEISGDLDIAGGAPADVDTWRIAAETSLRALYYLERGAVSAEGPRFAIAGQAQDEVRSSAARMLM
ncbi:MAG: BON domain-containing protein, partial [Oricola sp.]|nr:BON domain-containing protein [Oricola sp.]